MHLLSNRQHSVDEIIGSHTQQALDPVVSQRLQQDGQDVFANWYDARKAGNITCFLNRSLHTRHYSRDLSGHEASRRAAQVAVAAAANERLKDQYSGGSVQDAAHSNGPASRPEEGVPPARSSTASGGLAGPEPEPER